MELNFTPNFEEIQYLRVLAKIDFNVPRDAAWGFAAIRRYEIAKEFSPHWLSSRRSHYLPKLDRLVLLNQDAEVPDVESVLVHVAKAHHLLGELRGERQWCTVDLTFETEERFRLITSFDVDFRPEQEFVTLGKKYRDKYPNAKTAMALERIT